MNFTKFLRTPFLQNTSGLLLLKFVKTPILHSKPLWLLLLLNKNSRYYKRCIKQTPPRQFSILVNKNDLRETDLPETSKKAALIEQTLVVRRTPWFF